MSIRYLEGRYNRASGTRLAFAALSDDLVAEGYPPLVVNSGDREPQDQIDIFLSKFREQATGNGPYNDVRWWQGRRYVRVVGGGTVGVPATSNHEKRRANDLQYPYSANTAAHRRAQQLAPRFNITCEGMGFSEWWHWTYWGPLGTINGSGSTAGGGSVSKPGEEDDMFSEEDRELLAKVLTEVRNTKAGVWTGGSINGQTFKYGALPIVARNQQLLAQHAIELRALSAAVQSLAAAKGVDPAAVLAAVEAGVKNAMKDVTFSVDVG